MVNKIKRKSTKASDEQNDVFLNRLNNCQLLNVMDKIYKNDYDLSAKKYLLTIPARSDAENMVRVLESAPPSITDMFQRRLDCKCPKKKGRQHLYGLQTFQFLQ